MEWDVDAFGRTIPKLNRIVNPSNRRQMAWEDPNKPGQVLSKDAYNALQRQTQAEYEQERSAWRASNREWLTKTLPTQIDKGLSNLEKLATAGTLITPDLRDKEAMNQWHTPTQVDPATYNLTDKQINRYTFKKGQGFKSQWHLNQALKEGAILNTNQEKTVEENPTVKNDNALNRLAKPKEGQLSNEQLQFEADRYEDRGHINKIEYDANQRRILETNQPQDKINGKNVGYLTEWTTDMDTDQRANIQKQTKIDNRFGKEGTMTKNLQIASAVLEGLQKLQPKKESVNINWSNPYDEDNIRGYTGTWA